ncbi:mechanosensitive ion channel family protein [Sandarakinorhabdus sp.]|uniref:mechanosensitive ion channel family protein n=1 Tax=Sandarakinorhabdus sp. TaxID=1916663 RepID=UPI00286DF2A5|nr:mechanosensitive ion channel family protein [Sandarakinorhabdus sp.]
MATAGLLPRLTARVETLADDGWRWLSQDSGDAVLSVVVAAGLFVLLKGAFWLAARWLGRPGAGWRHLARGLVDRTLTVFLAMVAIDLTTHAVAPPGALLTLVDALFTIAAAVQGALWLREIILELVRRRAAPGGEDHASLGSAMGVISVLVNVVIWLLAAILVLDNLGVNVTALIAGLGVGGIAIGLAAQGIFSDLFAALAILFDRPFRVGDTISYGTSTGTVEAIGLKTTRIRSLSGEQLVMANTKLLDQQVANLRRIEERRVVLRLGVILQTPPALLARLPSELETLVSAQPDCRFERAYLMGFGLSSLDIELVFVVASPDPLVMMAARQAIMLAILERFTALGVAFAYPSQTSFTAGPDGRLIDPPGAA